MEGTLTLIDRQPVTVHVYTSPEGGLLANTSLIELPTQVLAVDAQYGLPYAHEAAEYAQSLAKPLSRLYVTHAHPDHYFGAGVFDAPGYALAGVKAEIDAAGDAEAAGLHAQAGDFVPERATKPEHVVRPGDETIDGVRLTYSAVHGTEADTTLTVGLPDQGIVLTGDVTYNNVHLFVADKNFDGWSETVAAMRKQAYDTVIPGHGLPGGTEIYDHVLEYLAAARDEVAQAQSGSDLKDRLESRFPDYEGTALLDVQNRYLYPEGTSGAA